MIFRNKVVWSPVEIEYLKKNRNTAVNQLTIALAKSRNAIKNKLDEIDGKRIVSKKNKKTNIGKRNDIKVAGKAQFFRSGWEANIARVLNYKKEKWTYEPKVFFFTEVRRGTMSYCPDFQLEEHTYLEVKGYLDAKGRAAVRRFKKYYPEEFKKLKAIVGRKNTKAEEFFISLDVPIYGYMNELSKKYKENIPNWE